MTRSVTALACLALALSLGGCGLFADKIDPKKEWTAAEYYKAAKEEFDAQSWDAAIKLYEQLEAKYPFGRFAQQAQIEVAYAYYKQGETAQAITALDKFIMERREQRAKALADQEAQPTLFTDLK